MCCLWAAFAAPAMAQSMTDDQLIKYVLQEKEKGTSQEKIVANLTRRGVTIDQLRRVKKKVEAEQKQLGARDLTTDGKATTNRTRSQREVDADRQHQRENYMVRSDREDKEWRYLDRNDKADMLGGEMGVFDLDSLDYYSHRYKDNQVFGRNIFSQENLSFEPNVNIATPQNYCLGAGDVVYIDIWGASQQTIESTISPDGTVVIEGVGPVKLMGMTVQAASQYLKEKLGAYYADCSISLTVGDTRSIIVQVLGEVVMPGTYTISSLATAFNALYAAGGISDIGTLRDIKVYRAGRVVAHIDVYDYLINGNSKGNVSLQDNDVIVVGPYDCLVEVRGKVKRPMFYEMRGTESLQQLLTYAGGYTGDAYTKNVRVVRKAGEEYSIHTVEEFEMNGFTLCDGDSVTVDSVIARFSNMVEVRGAVKHAGQFQMNGSIQTVRDLITKAEGLREDALTQRAVMHREKDDLTLEMVSLDLQGILDGSAPDVALRKNDVLFVPSKIDMTGEQTLRIAGEVNFPGTYQFASNTTVKDLILQAGGLTRAASTSKIDVFRRQYDPTAASADSIISQTFSFRLDNGFLLDDSVFYLQPYDEVQVRKSPAYSEQENVTITGSVNFDGQYAMTSKAFKLSDLVKLAGGLNAYAYAKGARLVRQMTAEEREQQEKSLKRSQIAMYEAQLEAEDKTYDRHLADTLLEMKMDLGYTYDVAINLETALAQPGGPEDIVLRANDQLVVPQFTNTVKISGEVMYPISINYVKGKSLSYYINRAGGYSKKASKSQTYAIYQNGSVDKLGRYDGGSGIEPGCEIVVPTKQKKQGMSTAEISVLGTSAASLTTMIVALINLLQ